MFVDVDFCSFPFLYCETLMLKNSLEAKAYFSNTLDRFVNEGVTNDYQIYV